MSDVLLFNAIIPLRNPIVAVQTDADQLEGEAGAYFLAKLEAFFMKPVVLVAWDADAKFHWRGAPCPEPMLTDDDVAWRHFELPPEPEIPF